MTDSSLVEPTPAEVMWTQCIAPITQALYRPYVRRLGLKGNEKAIDFGSGPGITARLIADILLKGNGHLTCIDISRVWVKVAQRRLRGYPNVDFMTGMVSDLRITPGSYDVVIIHLTMHEVERHLRFDAVRALSNALRYGGKVFIREPMREGHGMTADEIRELMSGNGLKEISYELTKALHFGPVYAGVFEKAE